MVMHLQRQRRARLHHDALDLEARALFEHGVSAPGPRDRAVQAVGLVVLQFQPFSHLAYLLCAVGMRDQNRIGRLDHNQVVDPNRGD
ncbi:hypothetical protein D3C78_1279630 [compost metagenome]